MCMHMDGIIECTHILCVCMYGDMCMHIYGRPITKHTYTQCTWTRIPHKFIGETTSILQCIISQVYGAICEHQATLQIVCMHGSFHLLKHSLELALVSSVH